MFAKLTGFNVGKIGGLVGTGKDNGTKVLVVVCITVDLVLVIDGLFAFVFKALITDGTLLLLLPIFAGFVKAVKIMLVGKDAGKELLGTPIPDATVFVPNLSRSKLLSNISKVVAGLVTVGGNVTAFADVDLVAVFIVAVFIAAVDIVGPVATPNVGLVSTDGPALVGEVTMDGELGLGALAKDSSNTFTFSPVGSHIACNSLHIFGYSFLNLLIVRFITNCCFSVHRKQFVAMASGRISKQ